MNVFLVVVLSASAATDTVAMPPEGRAGVPSLTVAHFCGGPLPRWLCVLVFTFLGVDLKKTKQGHRKAVVLVTS